MSELQRPAATEKSRDRILLVGILRQQMLDLEILLKEVAEAELRLTPPNRRAIGADGSTCSRRRHRRALHRRGPVVGLPIRAPTD